MGKAPFVSIIIPVFGAEDYIESCLNSVVSQDYSGEIECILVDDCAKDSSMKRAHKFIDNYKGVISFSILCHDISKGAAAARNTGIRHARGEYILFLDSDDCLTKDAISILSAPLLISRFDMVVGRYQEIGDRNGKGFSLPDYTLLEGKDILYHYLESHIPVVVWNKLIKKSFIFNNQLFFLEGVIFEDNLWSFGASIVSQTLYVVDKITYLYLIRNGSVMTSTPINKQLLSYRLVVSGMYSLTVVHQLKRNKYCHHYIECFRRRYFKMLCDDYRAFKSEYIALRRVLSKPWWDCFIMNAFHPLKQIRDFHLLFPPFWGAGLYLIYVRYVYYGALVRLKRTQ